jgi:tetratricopeptide (TPR) repeat protein
MTILALVLKAYNIVGTGFSIAGGINHAIKHFCQTTAEELFKESFDKVVKRYASDFADLTDPKTVEVDHHTFDNVIASLKDVDEIQFTRLNESEKIAKITTLFQNCIIVPNHQLPNMDFERRIRPIIERVIIDFYAQLPFKQEAFNQIVLEYIQNNIKNQDDAHTILTELSSKIDYVRNEVAQRLSEDINAIKDDTEKIKDDNKELKQTTQATFDLVSQVESRFDLNTSDLIKTAVAKEHHAEIDRARNLLKSHKPTTSLELLETLKKRTWQDASDDLKFSILTNMAAAQFALNNEQDTAKLLLQAFQYNPEDEKALSNRALAHLLLGQTEYAADYAKQTLEKNPANTDAYVILVGISEEEETLDEIIAKVPDYLQDSPQIAYAISELAKQRENFEAAKRWGEIMVDQGNAPDFKAAFATILINQVLEDNLAVGTSQLYKAQKQQLRRAVGLLTEAWDCVSNTELKDYRANWIINRGMAHFHLGELIEAKEDLDTALEIEDSNPILIKNRALLAFECGNGPKAVELLEKIESASEVPEAPIILANILFASERLDESITKLNDFLQTDLSPELQEKARRLLIKVYIAAERIKEAEQILTPMLESSPTSVLNLINAALISSKRGKDEEAISQLIEAYNYALDSKDFLEIVELAAELFINRQFKEAATLYEKLADTSQHSQLTQWLVQSYYNSGEIAKALKICQKLREKYGPLENISVMEVMIHEEYGDMNQAETVCKEYLNTFPNAIDIRIRLGMVLFRSNKMAEVNNVLESFPDSKNFSFLKGLSLEACVQFAQLHQVTSKPEEALQIMYEVRRTRLNKPDAHLRYIGLFYQVEKQIPDVLNPTQVQLDTAVQIDISGQDHWYIIEDRDDPNISRDERNINEPIVQKMLDKVEDGEIIFRETPDGPKIGKIVAIKSKFVHAHQESCREYEHLFPTDEGMEKVQLDTSDAIDDKERFKPVTNRVDRHHEYILKIEKLYKENNLTIGGFTSLVGRNSLDTWGTLMGNPELGIRCCIGDIEERTNALNQLHHSQPKLVVDIISLITLHSLDAADIVVNTFGKFCIAQSTIDELHRIISEREGMWSQREGIVIGKRGKRYVKQIISPEETERSIEYLRNLIDWIRENCEVGQATAGLEMNQLRRRELNDTLQQHFLDTVLLASQPEHLLFSDDGRLRHYAKTSLNSDAGTNFQIDGVWTQVLLEHCVKQNLLDKADYDEMTIKLVCSHYYHTQFDADLLMEVAELSNWKLSEPYNSFVLALGEERMNLNSALDVCVDFLFKLWEESIPFRQQEFLTLGLLTGLTYGRNAHTVLGKLIYLIQNKHTLFLPVENSILRQIRNFQQIYPLEDNFMFLAENDIRLKGTRVGIETILYEYIYNSRPPEVIDDHYYTPTLEQIYATILYYLQNQEKVGTYLEDYLEYCRKAREEYEKDPPPGVVRLRKLIAESENVSDNLQHDSASATQSSSKNEQG